MQKDRTYTEEEVAVIFERAAQAQKTAQQQAHKNTGLTLSELQQIGANAGIDPAFIERAATAMGHLETAPPPTKQLGLPVAVSRTVNLPAPLTDAAWDQLVVDLRETFNAHGNVRQDGSLRQWTNGNLKVLAEPTREGQRLRLETMNANGRSGISAGIFSIAAALVFVVLALFADQTILGEFAIFIGLFLSMGIGSLGYSLYTLPGWAKTRQQQMEAIALHAVEYTTPVSESTPEAAPQPQLDLDTLGAPEHTAHQTTAQRIKT